MATRRELARATVRCIVPRSPAWPPQATLTLVTIPSRSSSPLIPSPRSALRSIIPDRFPLPRDRQPPPVRRRAGDGNPLHRGWGGQVRVHGLPWHRLRAAAAQAMEPRFSEDGAAKFACTVFLGTGSGPDDDEVGLL